MKKIINVKSKKSLIENLIETAIKVGDKDYEKKLRKRVVDLSRARDLAKGALKRAEENGQADLAEKLRARIEEIDTLLATYNADTLEDDPVSGGASDGSEADENSGSDQDEDSEDENDSDGQNNSENGNDPDDEDSDEQSDDQNGEGDGDDSESDADQKGKGDGEDSDSEDDQNGSQSQEQDSDENDDNAEDKTGSEGDAKNSQNDNKKADQQDGAGEDDQSDSDDSAEDSGIHNDIGSREGSEPDDQQDGQSKNGKDSKNSQDNNSQNKDSSGSNGSSSNASENEDESSDQNSNGGEGSESDSQGQTNNNQQDSEGGDSDENEDESANDSSDNGQNSKNQQDADSQKSNSSNPDKKDSKNTSSSKPSLEQDDSEGDGESDFQNPFADDDDISSNGGLPTGGKQPREATKDETIELLGTLTGEGREGAKEALKELIAKRKAAAPVESFKPTSGQSLTEAIKGVRDMTDDEFGDYINDTYDLIDKADPVNYIDDIEARKKKVGNWSQDPTVAQDLFGEDDFEIQKSYQKKKARDIAKARYSSISGLDDFQMDLYSAIHNQIEMVRQEILSYDEINAEYESEDIIMKAEITRELPAEAKPIIDVYFDVSGSWEEKDIKIGEAAIASVKVFEDQGDIVLNVFYFSDDVDNVSMDHCRDAYGYGTHAWPKILQNIKANDAKNVIIMTDDDFERLSSWDDPSSPKMNGSLTVDGCVWYLWKNGNASPCCLPKLKGRQGTRQYGFRS